ncbi:MAG: ABC transporter substrate-binding protein [Candidatus Aminicenantaceae bacterium]
MRKGLIFLLLSLFTFLCCDKSQERLYTIGIFQVNDAPHLNEARKGLIHALEGNGLVDGVNVSLIIKNGKDDIAAVQKIAQDFVREKVDMMCTLSTPCLQAALNSTHIIPIIFTSVANPYLVGAGRSPEDHLSNVTGIASTGPIKQSLEFIKKILPEAKRIGTLWTPSEINSEYYLELCRNGARELGLEIVAVPVANKSEVLLSAQILVNKKIDAIYQISDNTINASFEAVSKAAKENSIPLFGGFPLSTHLGACAAMGWDFFDMGYKTGKIALRVKDNESPARIPIQYMKKIKLHLNLQAAEKQGIAFSDEIMKRADEILGMEESPTDNF